MRRAHCIAHGRDICVCDCAALAHALALHLRAHRIGAARRTFGRLCRAFAAVLVRMWQ